MVTSNPSPFYSQKDDFMLNKLSFPAFALFLLFNVVIIVEIIHNNNASAAGFTVVGLLFLAAAYFTRDDTAEISMVSE